jgi:hypothetical protein
VKLESKYKQEAKWRAAEAVEEAESRLQYRDIVESKCLQRKARPRYRTVQGPTTMWKVVHPKDRRHQVDPGTTRDKVEKGRSQIIMYRQCK